MLKLAFVVVELINVSQDGPADAKPRLDMGAQVCGLATFDCGTTLDVTMVSARGA